MAAVLPIATVLGRPFVKRPLSVLLSVLSVCPVCDVGVLWPNGWMDHGQMAGWIKMSLGTGVDLGPGDFVLDGTQPPQKRGQSPLPNFLPISVVAKRLDALRCHLVWM